MCDPPGLEPENRRLVIFVGRRCDSQSDDERCHLVCDCHFFLDVPHWLPTTKIRQGFSSSFLPLLLE